MPQIQRRRAVSVKIGSVVVGSDAPVVVQSMTNTDTADVEVDGAADCGAGACRLGAGADHGEQRRGGEGCAVHRRGIRREGLGDADYRRLPLQRAPVAEEVSGDARGRWRSIASTPATVSIGRKDDDNFRTMVEVAVEHQKPVRIGVNWGSLDQALLTKMMDENSKIADPLPARDVMMEAMVVSALDNAAAAERYGLRRDQIILRPRFRACAI